MKTPICSFDAKTGTLCAKCEAKLHSGHIKASDVEGSIVLTKLAEYNSDINRFTMFGATKVEEDFILILRTPDISFLRANPIIVSKIKNEFQSGVWFVEGEATDRRFIENLFFPAKIISINLIWLPDGNKLTRVIVEERQDPRYGADIKKIQKIAKAVRNMELIIEFEHKN